MGKLVQSAEPKSDVEWYLKYNEEKEVIQIFHWCRLFDNAEFFGKHFPLYKQEKPRCFGCHKPIPEYVMFNVKLLM